MCVCVCDATTLSIMTFYIFDTQHNETQHNDSHHNETQNNDTQYYDTVHYGRMSFTLTVFCTECFLCKVSFMMNVVILSVMAPCVCVCVCVYERECVCVCVHFYPKLELKLDLKCLCCHIMASLFLWQQNKQDNC